MKNKVTKKRTLYDAFESGFLAGMAVVHSQNVYEQQEDYFKAWKKGEEKWITKVFEKYQKADES